MLPPPLRAGGASGVWAVHLVGWHLGARTGGRAAAPARAAPTDRGGALKPSELRLLDRVQADLARLARYDAESVAGDAWVRQRYASGAFPGLAAARAAAVRTAWHEAGNAVAALAVGARFSSASIHLSPRSEGRVHGIRGGGELAFVVDAAGQI